MKKVGFEFCIGIYVLMILLGLGNGLLFGSSPSNSKSGGLIESLLSDEPLFSLIVTLGVLGPLTMSIASFPVKWIWNRVLATSPAFDEINNYQAFSLIVLVAILTM